MGIRPNATSAVSVSFWRYGGVLLLGTLVGASVSQGATYYVDGNCPSSGAGTSINCGSSGPKKTISEGIALLSTAGDVLRVRGIHPPHDGETSTFDGRYFGDEFAVSQAGSSASPIRIEPYNYSTIGTGEKVFLDGTRLPSSSWTKCSSCTAGVCAGVPSAACSETWYATDSGPASLVLGAQKDDGSPTFRVDSPSDLTNSNPGYNAKRCSADIWKACDLDSDCGPGNACSAQSPEIDSYSPQNGGAILVRWGPSLPSRPYVFYSNAGTGFTLKPTASNVTIQGFNLRCRRRAAFYVDGSSSVRNLLLVDNRIFYVMDRKANGSDYGAVSYGATGVTFRGNEIAYTGSEGIHTEAASGGSVLTISENYIHHQGDQSVLGPGTVGTPSGMILGERGGSNGPGDYSGSIVARNLIAYQKDSTPLGSTGRGIIIENNSNNWTLRDNVFYRVSGECVKLDAQGTSTNNNAFFNNLFLECGLKGGNVSGNGPGIWVAVGSGKSATGNKVYNNTFVNNNGGAIALSCGGTCSGNEFRNNIMLDSGSRKLMDWASAGTFQHNIVFSKATGTVLTFSGRNWGCSSVIPSADIDGDGSGNDFDRCVDPLFKSISGNDYHLGSGSPAIDAGTGTGVPAARTGSINNVLAGLYGFPAYADNVSLTGQTWDVGAVEFIGGSLSAGITLSDPSPTAGGSVVVTLTTSVPVVQLPGPLSFLASDSSTHSIVLNGPVGGTVFTGTFFVDGTVPDGLGTFVLPPGSLVDASGNTGNSIATGSQTVIDKTPPSSPSNLRVDG